MTDLTDRMRTCAAAILDDVGNYYHDVLPPMLRDAADLLIEASNALESYQPQTEPMEIIPPLSDELKRKIDTVVAETEEKLVGTWIAPGGPLPGAAQMRPPRACPKCDSRATKTVHRLGNRMMLRCHVCGCEWPYMKRPPAGGSADGQD